MTMKVDTLVCVLNRSWRRNGEDAMKTQCHHSPFICMKVAYIASKHAVIYIHGYIISLNS